MWVSKQKRKALIKHLKRDLKDVRNIREISVALAADVKAIMDFIKWLERWIIRNKDVLEVISEGKNFTAGTLKSLCEDCVRRARPAANQLQEILLQLSPQNSVSKELSRYTADLRYGRENDAETEKVRMSLATLKTEAIMVAGKRKDVRVHFNYLFEPLEIGRAHV